VVHHSPLTSAYHDKRGRNILCMTGNIKPEIVLGSGSMSVVEMGHGVKNS